VEFDYDVIDPDDTNLEIRCRVFNMAAAKKYEELIPLSITGDIGYPVTMGTDKHITLIFDPAIDQSNLSIVLSAIDRQPINIHEIISQVDSNKLKAHLDKLQGKRNTGDQFQYDYARAYINHEAESHLKTNSLPFSNNYTGINYEANKLGVVAPSNIVVMDAHYDSAPNSPGADDNGSGVVGVLEALRILSDYSFKKSIRFLFFDLEELGLVGSTVYGSSQLNKKDSIKAVLNYEMIGYYSDQPNTQTFPAGFNLLFPDAYNQVLANSNRGDFITNVANTFSSPLKKAFDNYANTYVPELKVISVEIYGKGEVAPDLRRSDHAVFWDKNIPALMITDGANFRNKNYHTTKDSITYLNFNFMTNVVKATMATMINLAEIEHGTSVEYSVDLSTATVDATENSFNVNYKNNYFSITSNESQKAAPVKLYDLTGNLICKDIIDLTENQLTKWNCSGLNIGMYFLSIEFPSGIQSQKIFVDGQ
jgi:hypothetical protein